MLSSTKNPISYLTGLRHQRSAIASKGLAILCLAFAYYGLAELSRNLASTPQNVTPIWPPDGLASAAVLLCGYWVLPGVFLGSLISNVYAFLDFSSWGSLSLSSLGVLTIATGTMMGTCLGVFSLKRLSQNNYPFSHVRGVFLFVMLTGALGPSVNAFFGATALSFSHKIDWAAWGPVWLVWWISNVTGILILMPLIVSWEQLFKLRRFRLLKSIRYLKVLEGLYLLGLLSAISTLAFKYGQPIEYMLIPLLLWATFRFGQAGVTLGNFIVSAVAVIATVRGIGSFASSDLNESLGLLQSFIAVIVLTTLMLGAVLAERTKAESNLNSALQELAQTNEQLEQRVEARTKDLELSKAAADQANQAKSDFLANMSHELRTPLNGILGYAQILGRTQTLSDKDRSGVNVIYQCGSHLLTLINDILDLSKIEARKLDLATTALHLPSLLQSVVEMCKIKAEQKGIEFVYQPSSRLPEGVEADEKRLRQVLINLLGNAVKFTERGAVTLRVDVLSLDEKRTSLLFQIVDTGVGIAEADRGKLFQVFEQVGDQKKQAEGTGLGLAISQRIVQLMGGRIQLKSQMGMGSEFFFTVELPLAENWAEQQGGIAEGDRITGYEGDRRQILVVDDRWENRAVVQNLLAPLSFTIIEAENGQEGLTQLRKTKPDLVITDLAMPVMDGFEFLNCVRSAEDLKSARILVSSASVSQLDQQMALDAGGDDFLVKPVDARSLFQLISTHLELTWIYEPQEASLSQTASRSTEIVLPPRATLENLLAVAQKSQLKALREQLEQLTKADRQYEPFAQPMLEMAGRFMAEEIEELLKQYLTEA